MAKSTGPLLAAGAIAVTNRVIFNEQPIDWRVVSGIGFAAVFTALIEKPLPELAIGISWLALTAVLLTRVDPSVPSPAEGFVKWWNAK